MRRSQAPGCAEHIRACNADRPRHGFVALTSRISADETSQQSGSRLTTRLWSQKIMIIDPRGRHRDCVDAAEEGTSSTPRSSSRTDSGSIKILDAYDTFGHAAKTHALKVIITA